AAEPVEVDLGAIRERVSSEMPKPPPGVRVNIQDIVYSLKALMWRQMGVERTRAGIEDALSKIVFWSRAVAKLGPNEPRALELVVGVRISERDGDEFEEDLTEACGLAAAAEAEVVGERFLQRKPRADPATLFGSGKVDEIKLEIDRVHPDAIVVDNDLTPAQ